MNLGRADMPRFRSEPFQLLSSPLLLHFSSFSLPCPSVHTHWQQLQSQWDALHSWQRKNTAAGERKQIQIWHCPLPSCSVRAPVKTDLLVWFLNHCKLLFSVYLLRINPCLRRGKDFSFKGRGWGLKQQAESSLGHVQKSTYSKVLFVVFADPLRLAQR